MKLIYLYKIPIILFFLIQEHVFASESVSNSLDAGQYSILSILPPLIAIILALITHEAHLALFLGIWLGSAMVVHHPVVGLTHALDTYIVQSVTDHGHASILIFTMAFGGLIGVISANGGMAGAVHTAARYATSNRRSQLATTLMGFVIFFDDYANTLLVGNMMRPFTDRVKISREKLSYLVDSTASPVASLAFISSWSVFQMSLLESPYKQFGISVNPYLTFLQSIPFSFYCILTLVFIIINVLLKREYGPMLEAENRAVLTGKVLADNAKPLSDPSLIEENNIELVLSNSSYIGRDLIAFLSVDFKTSPVSNVTNFEISNNELTAINSINGGESEYKVKINSDIKLLLIRPKSFEQAEIKLNDNFETKEIQENENSIDVFDIHIEEKSGPQLEDSKIVISAGRGMVESSNLKLVEELANKLNAAIGGTRAIVDAGWMPYSNQVGQTGKTVKPDVYIACGISGATQHQVGMKDSKYIIAINKDEEAPIFQISDLGIVGDTLSVIPKLNENL